MRTREGRVQACHHPVEVIHIAHIGSIHMAMQLRGGNALPFPIFTQLAVFFIDEQAASTAEWQGKSQE